MSSSPAPDGVAAERNSNAARTQVSYLSDSRKRALVAHTCLALELHAQLEEEIFSRRNAHADARSAS